MSTPLPPRLTRDIGVAERTLRAILNHHITAAGLTFTEWVDLTLLTSEGPQTDDELVATQVAGQVGPADEIREGLDRLLVNGLVARDDAGQLTVTTAGHDVFGPLREQVGAVSAQVNGGLPADDVEAALRILDEVIARAAKIVAELEAA